MDLLGSILNSMDKPPSHDEKKKEMLKSIIFNNLEMRCVLHISFYSYRTSSAAGTIKG